MGSPGRGMQERVVGKLLKPKEEVQVRMKHTGKGGMAPTYKTYESKAKKLKRAAENEKDGKRKSALFEKAGKLFWRAAGLAPEKEKSRLFRLSGRSFGEAAGNALRENRKIRLLAMARISFDYAGRTARGAEKKTVGRLSEKYGERFIQL